MKIRIKVGTLVYNGKTFKNSDVVEIDKEELEKFDKRDYEIVSVKKK